MTEQHFKEAKELIGEMFDHLDYCGWGRDSWERECGEETRKRAEAFCEKHEIRVRQSPVAVQVAAVVEESLEAENAHRDAFDDPEERRYVDLGDAALARLLNQKPDMAVDLAKTPNDKEIYEEVEALATQQAALLAKLEKPLWRSFDGTVTAVPDMTDSHLANSIAMLERNGSTDKPIYKHMLTERAKRDAAARERAKKYDEERKPHKIHIKGQLAVPTEEELAEGKRLFDEGVWWSTSNKFFNIARLPEGMNGREALRWAYLQHNNGRLLPHEEEHLDNFGESAARAQFLRVYTCYNYSAHLSRTLSPGVFRAFRLAGGQSA